MLKYLLLLFRWLSDIYLVLFYWKDLINMHGIILFLVPIVLLIKIRNSFHPNRIIILYVNDVKVLFAKRCFSCHKAAL